MLCCCSSLSVMAVIDSGISRSRSSLFRAVTTTSAIVCCPDSDGAAVCWGGGALLFWASRISLFPAGGNADWAAELPLDDPETTLGESWETGPPDTASSATEAPVHQASAIVTALNATDAGRLIACMSTPRCYIRWKAPPTFETTAPTRLLCRARTSHLLSTALDPPIIFIDARYLELIAGSCVPTTSVHSPDKAQFGRVDVAPRCVSHGIVSHMHNYHSTDHDRARNADLKRHHAHTLKRHRTPGNSRRLDAHAWHGLNFRLVELVDFRSKVDCGDVHLPYQGFRHQIHNKLPGAMNVAGRVFGARGARADPDADNRRLAGKCIEE